MGIAPHSLQFPHRSHYSLRPILCGHLTSRLGIAGFRLDSHGERPTQANADRQNFPILARALGAKILFYSLGDQGPQFLLGDRVGEPP